MSEIVVPSIEIVKTVAKNVVMANFRGDVFGRHGMYIDKAALRNSSTGFDVSEYIEQSKKLKKYVAVHGPLKF
jgi:hypothetical protein